MRDMSRLLLARPPTLHPYVIVEWPVGRRLHTQATRTPPPTRTDANRLILFEETAADLFSYDTLSSYSQEDFLFRFCRPSERGFRVACEVVYQPSATQVLYDLLSNII